MLKIKIGNTYAETSGIEIPVTLRSPLFLDSGRIPGSYVFNFSLPYTDELKRELGFIHRPNRFGDQVLSRPFLLSQGPLQYSGTCKVVNASEKTIEVSCPIETGDLAAKLKSIKLPEIDLGGDRLPTEETIRCNAVTSAEIEVNSSNPTEFTEVIAPVFNTIRENPDSELASAGTSFVSSIDNELTFIFTLDSISFATRSATFRLYKNSVLVYSWAISNRQTVTIDQVVADGDVYTWDILLESIGDTEHEIRFTLYDTCELTISLAIDEMSQNGQGLYPTQDYASFPIDNEGFAEKLEDDTFSIDHDSAKEIYTKYFPIINYYKNDRFPVFLSGQVNGEQFSAFNLFTPFPYLAYVINQLFAALDIKIQNNVFEDSDLSQLVIYNNYCENNFLNNDLFKPKSGFNLADHVPDVAASEYLLNLCKLLGIALVYNSKTQTISFKYLKDIVADKTFIEFPGLITSRAYLNVDKYSGFTLKQESSGDSYVTENFKTLDGLSLKGSVTFVNQLSGISNPEINDCYYVSFSKEYWVWNYDTELGILNWIFYSKNFLFEKTDGDDDNKFELTSRISALMTNAGDTADRCLIAPANRHWLIPRTKYAGNFEGLPPYFKSEIPLNLLFYRAQNYDSLGNLYPIATNDVYDYSGARISLEGHNAALSLHWEGEYGLYEKRHKAWLDWLLDAPGYFTIKVYLDAYQLSNIDFFKWYRINHHDYLIREIRFNITDQGISVAEMDIMKR